MISASGAGERKLCEFPGEAQRLSWSSRGDLLATSYRASSKTPWSVNVIHLPSCQLRQITFPKGQLTGDVDPSFGPAGTSMAFVRQHLDTYGEIHRIQVDAAGAPLGEPQLMTSAGQFVSGLAWTANGAGLVFSAYREGTQTLWRVSARAEGKAIMPDRVPMINPPAYGPSIGIRSDVLVYRHWALEVNVWRCPGPRASEQERRSPEEPLIASTLLEESPQFSPDGRRVVFVSNRSGTYELWVADSEGANASQLTFFEGPHLGSPQFSPDGRWIVFDSVAAGNRDIYVVSSGGGRAPVSGLPSAEERPGLARYNDPWMVNSKLLKKMQEDWDRRARQNARYFVNTAKTDWTDDEFFRSGEQTVAEEILTDMINICQGKQPGQMRVLEIGCGAGRVTRALARLFGEVHGVDISGEMIARAREALRDFPNVFLYQNNGMDLSVLPPDLIFDFAFSSIVFQHIPSREIIENYVREVHRVLRPGALFKFQVQGDPSVASHPDDTWVGVPFSEQQAVEMALRCGFDPRYRYGAGRQYFWLWYFKTGEPQPVAAAE